MASLLKVYRLPLAKKSRYMGLGIILGLCFLYLSQSCTLNHLSETHYSIGQDAQWPNLNLMGKERNLSAFNQQLLRAVAKQENFQFQLTASSDLLEELEQGKLQGILTILQPDYSNEKGFLFSTPYFLTGPVLITTFTAPVDGWSEQRKKIIGIQKSSPLVSSFERDPSIKLKFYDDILSALSDLADSRIDGAIFPVIPAYTYTQTFYKHELKITTAPLTDQGMRLMTLKNQRGEALIQKFNQGLEKLKQNGMYQELLEHWGFINPEHTAPK